MEAWVKHRTQVFVYPYDFEGFKSELWEKLPRACGSKASRAMSLFHLLIAAPAIIVKEDACSPSRVNPNKVFVLHDIPPTGRDVCRIGGQVWGTLVNTGVHTARPREMQKLSRRRYGWYNEVLLSALCGCCRQLPFATQEIFYSMKVIAGDTRFVRLHNLRFRAQSASTRAATKSTKESRSLAGNSKEPSFPL